MKNRLFDQRMKAERKLRRDLDKMQDTILDYHCGNLRALVRAQDDGRRRIMDAVQRNEILPVVAEDLKIKLDNWGY